MPKNPYGKNESTKKNTSYETDDMFSRMSKLASNNFNISGTTYQTTKKNTTTSNSGSKTASASGSYTTRNTTVQDNKEEEEKQKYSLGKGIAGVTRQGIQQVAQGFADTLAFGEDLFWSPYELLTGQQLGSVSDRKPLNRLAGGVREETQAVYDKYASNVEAGGTAAKIFDEYGTATIAAIPQALMALMTAGTSATAQTTAGLTQAATKALNPGTVNTVRNAVTSMAKDPNYWYAFAQVTGSSYESAIADMEQQVENGEKQYDNNTIRTKAALQALGNGLMNAAVEVGGGIQKLPSELQGGQSVWKAIVDTAVDEGKEEVVQGIIERAMQNLVYDKGNAFASLTDEDAVFSAKGAAKEFAGGAVVGGILGGAQIGSVYGINKGIESYNQNRIGSAYNMDINALIDEGLQSDPSTDSYKMASQLKAKVDNGGTVSNRQAYNLAVANQQAIDMENQQQAQTAAPSTQTAQTVQTASPSTAPVTSRVQTIQTRLVESGMDSAEAETAASSLSRILSGDITVTNKDKDVLSVGKTAARQVFEEETGVKLPASNSSTRRTVSEYITQTALSQQEVQTQPQQTHDQTSAQTDEITHPSTETAQSGESVLRKAAYENVVEAQKRRSAQVIRADMVSLGENGKRVYQKNVTGAKNISGFSNAFQRYYDAGTIGLKFEDIRTMYDSAAPRSVLYEAYAAGVNDAKAKKSDVKAKSSSAKAKTSAKKTKGAFTDKRKNKTGTSVSSKDMDALKAMAKTFGVDIELVDTIADGSIANGYYSNGKIVIAADSYNPLLTVAKHEVTHHIQRVSPELYQAYKDYVMSAFYNNSQNAMNDEIQRQINLANEADIKMTRQEAMDEIVANATEKFLTDRDSIDQLARQNRSLGEAILNAIRDVLKKIQSALQGAKMRGYSDFMNAEQLKKAEQMWVEALADASTKTVEFRTGDGQTVVEDTKGNPIAVVQENGSAVFSLKTYEEGGRDYLETWLEKRVKGKKLSRADADSLIGQMDEYYDICKQFTDKYAPFGAWSKAEVVRDSKGKPVFSVVKANGEYAMNLDFSLVCKKRRTLDAVFSEMINRGILDDADLSEAEISNINSIIRENGFETACALCFVDSKRYRQAKVADSFVDQYNELVKMLLPEDGSVSAHYFDFIGTGNYKNEGAGLHTMSDADLKDGIAKLRQVMKDNGDKTVPYKIAKHLLATKSDRKLLTRSEFMNTTGFEAVKTKNPSVMKLYNSSKGSGGPKATFSDVQYLGDILKKNAWTPAKAYAVGGVRIQSFSDYIPRLVFDYIQMIGDLSAKQLPAHAYTKEAMFAKQFGMTGIKINLSLVPAIAEDGVAPGLDANGNYYWYDGQSFGSDVNVKGSGNTGFELAKQIQNAPGYSANCGTIAVGVSDEHIRKMLDDPDIRMVIPYHKSSLNHIVSVMNNIDAYKDYTDVQNTRDKKTGSKITGKEFNYNEALRRTGDAKTAAAEYLAWCEENGYLPKFDQFADNENYYKLLEDFATYDNGKAVPQGPVTMTFPKDGDAFGSMSDLIKEGLEEDAVLEARREKSVPGIVDQIEAVLKKKDGDVKKQFSLKDVPPVHPTNGKWERGATFDEVKAEHPTLFELDADDAEVRNPTQITGTVKSYRKIYDSLKAEGFDGTILDASSGLGYGTKAGIEEYGFDVEDIEPFPDASYHPKYTDYSTLDKQYDVIISNAVLNVIPQDLRDNMVVKIGEMLKPGGRAFINVRGKDVLNASSKVAINEDQMEYFISSTGSYQKGFTKKELVGYLQDALGEGFTVEPTSKYGAVAAIVTKDSDPDIRYQFKETEKLLRENEKLRETVNGLKEQFKTTKVVKTDKRSLDSFAKSLLKDYSSDADSAEVRSALDDLFSYMANGENGDPPVWNDVFRKAYDVAVYVLQNATEVNDDLATEYSDLRHVLRTRGISINKDYDHDLIGYESINDFRKANMGRIKITNDGLPVDVAYQELAESYPGFFDEKEHMTQPDQLNHIEEVLDRLAPVEYNPYERTMRESATWLANEIIDRFFDLPQEKPTYADVMEGKVAKAKYEGKKKLDAERQKNRETVKKLISEHKEAQKQAVAAEREKQKAIQERKLSDLKAKHKEQMKAVRDERDAKLKAQHQKDMESKEKQLAKLRQSMEDRLDKEKQKQKEKGQKRKDKAERDKVVTKIQTDVEWLSERLLNPTDSKHIPEDFKRKVASFLENIDFTTTKSEKQYDKTGKVSQKQIRMAELLNAYKEIANDESSELILSPIEDEMYNALLELSDKGKRFDELEYDELVLIHDIIRYIKKGVASANRAFNKEIKDTITGLGENVISENVSKKKNNAPTSGVASASYRLLHYDMVQPQDKFHEIGGTMEMLYKEIRKGFDKHILNIKSACEYMQNLVKGHEDDIKDWSGKTAKAATFTLEDGSTIDLTVGQVMSLYELMKRPQAVGHILEDGQGIIPSNVLVEANKKLFGKIKVKGTKRIDATQASHVTINDIMNICSSLTEDQMKIADGIQRFFNTVCSDWGNETSMTLYDYKKFVEENYFPIKSSDIYLNTRFDDSGDVLLKNMSFTKSLTKKANNPIVVEDIFDVMTNHVNQMSMYNALVVPLTDFSRVFNYRNKESNQSVKGSIIHSDGTLGYQYIVDFIKDINREARPLKEEEVVNKLISKYKKSAVAGSIRVLVQQPTSIVRATEMISPEYIVKGLFQNANYDEMFKWSPIAYWKSLGFFETNMGRSMKGILLGDDGNMVDKLTLDIYGKADDFAWAHLWNAVKLETMDKHPGIDPASDRFMKIVSGRFEEIVDRTQVVDTVFHRSQIMRSTTAFNKMATAFMAERTKSYNLLRSDIWVDAVKNKDKSKVARALVVYVATETVNAMVQGLYDAFNDPEDEDKDGEKRSYLDKYLDNTWENIKTNINPLNMIVYLKEIQSIFDGFTVERMDMAAVSDVISTAKKFAQGKYRYGYLVKELAEDFSGLTGIPIKNVNRQITLIVRSAGNLIGGTYYAEYWVDKLKYNIQDSKNRSVFYKHYTDALLAGYDAQADMMLADMVSNGIPYENIIAKGYAAEKKVAFKDASNLLNEGKESEAKDVIKALAKKYDKKYTTLWKAVKEGASATVPEETYDFNDYKKAVLKGQDTEMIEDYLTQYGGYSEEDLEEAAKMLTDKYK